MKVFPNFTSVTFDYLLTSWQLALDWLILITAAVSCRLNRGHHQKPILPKSPKVTVTNGPVALGDKNFVSSVEFQEKFWFNKFMFQIFLLNAVSLGNNNLIFYA